MQEIKCPNCGEVFQVDESGYAAILQQVRDDEFRKELERRSKELESIHKSDLQIARMEKAKEQADAIAEKESEIADKNREITELKAKIDASDTEKKLAISDAEKRKEQELYEKDKEIAQLKAKIMASEAEKKLAISEAEQKKEKELSEKINEITELKGKLTSTESEGKLKETALKEKYEEQLKDKDEQIAYYKDFKARQSTKMVGESLEQHCYTQFNSIRMTAFPNAYFEKDNDSKTGSKGDFIFRECAEDGTEFISIMFEMKNENETTATKHKNEHFYKELDKDRNEKGCEYAVLVSMLEMDNELFNNGIVDVSYKYPKMYVIRPQFFIPIISLLRNAALNSLKYQQELQIVKNQQLDIINFENNMNVFKEGFARNYELASRKFNDAISEIDKSIAQLQKVKDALTSSERNLRLANDKAQDLSIKKLTKNSPTIREMFNNLKVDE